FGTNTNAHGIVWGDWDNDGRIDIITGENSSFNERLYRNNGATFTPFSIGPTAGNSLGVSLGDYDSDGDLDLAVSNTDINSYIVRNDLVMSPSSPTASAANLGTTFTEYGLFSSSGVVTFNWDAGTDVQTSTAALNYYVRVGTTTGGSQIMRIPKRGVLGQGSYNSSQGYLYSTQASGTGRRGTKIVMQKETTAYWAIVA